MDIKWYYHRLQTMSVPEIFYRISQFLQKRKEKKKLVAFFPDVKLAKLPQPVLAPLVLPYDNYQPVLDIFGISFNYQAPINWHLDIASGKEFPKTFAKDIDIRTDKFGSAKHVWEVNRLQFLTRIAMQYRATGDADYLKQFQEITESWISENPYLQGVNWYSNIEVNLRLITWFLSWEILDVNQIIQQNKDFRDFVEKNWIPSIYLHCLYNYDNPSKFSSANNHLISEYAGLFIAASFWKFNESKKWLTYAKAGLEKEIIKQHSENGINKEEAAEYIQFITDFFLLPYVVGEKTNNIFSSGYKKMLKKICYYIYHLMDTKGNIPFYGDEDDGKTFILYHNQYFNNFKSILTSGAIIFNDPKLKRKSNGFDSRNAILFGKEGEKHFAALAEDNAWEESVFFKEEGHCILKKQTDKKEIYLHFDAAPLGFLSIAAHGHADALSWVMYVDGYPVFVDSGTYVYHTDPDWRKYFMGTLSHNTIRVDYTDQAKITGPTMWADHYKAGIIEMRSNNHEDYIKAFHTGYITLGVKHERELYFDKQNEKIVIKDHVFCKEPHFFEMPLHVHPDANIKIVAPNEFMITNGKSRAVLLKVDEKLKPSVLSGQSDPILGWYSPSFQKKIKGQTIYNTITSASTTFTTEIYIKDRIMLKSEYSASKNSDRLSLDNN